MWSARRSIDIAVTFCAVGFVFCVSGFAQSNTSARLTSAVDRTAHGAMRVYVADAAGAPSIADLPPNLDVPPTYRRLIQSMIAQSPTFRRQCVRLAHSPELFVTLLVGPARVYLPRARTRIVKKGGRLFATIEVLRLEHPVELIAHEIEHVIEQLDGIDLAARAGVAASGVRLISSEMVFETARATRVGLAVLEEVRRAGG